MIIERKFYNGEMFIVTLPELCDGDDLTPVVRDVLGKPVTSPTFAELCEAPADVSYLKYWNPKTCEIIWLKLTTFNDGSVDTLVVDSDGRIVDGSTEVPAGFHPYDPASGALVKTATAKITLETIVGDDQTETIRSLVTKLIQTYKPKFTFDGKIPLDATFYNTTSIEIAPVTALKAGTGLPSPTTSEFYVNDVQFTTPYVDNRLGTVDGEVEVFFPKGGLYTVSLGFAHALTQAEEKCLPDFIPSGSLETATGEQPGSLLSQAVSGARTLMSAVLKG